MENQSGYNPNNKEQISEIYKEFNQNSLKNAFRQTGLKALSLLFYVLAAFFLVAIVIFLFKEKENYKGLFIVSLILLIIQSIVIGYLLNTIYKKNSLIKKVEDVLKKLKDD